MSALIPFAPPAPCDYCGKAPCVCKFGPPRPRVRRDCFDIPRPCPYVGCRHNTYLEVQSDGKLRLPAFEPEDAKPETSCSLDVAEDGEHKLTEVAEVLGMTHIRAKQICSQAMMKLAADPRLQEIAADGFEHPAGYRYPPDAGDV